MKPIAELKQLYKEKLQNYRFNNEAEALEQGITPFLLAEKDEFTALESPYTMRHASKAKHVLTKDTVEYIEEESSSEAISSEDAPFYDDIILNMDLFVKGKQIIDNAQLTLVRNEKYGLVGRNGVGKTTLLKAIRKRKFNIPKGLKIHAIKQDYVSDERVIDFVGPDAGRILSGLGFSRDQQEQTIRSLSGGWRMRAQIARAIHAAPDLLLLDEPTNFLDIRAIGYLEQQVRNMKTVIIVSHDRHFLNATTGHILHLNGMKIDVYKGNYDAFVNQKEARAVSLAREYGNQMVERAHLQAFIDRFRYSASRAAQAQSKIKMLEKMPVLNPPVVEPVISFNFAAAPINGTLIEFENIKFCYSCGAKQIFNGLNLKINHTARIVIVGENGKGKSTLLKMIAGLVRADSGVAELHPGLRVGYFAQHHVDHLDHNEYTLSFLTSKGYREEDARAAMANFGLNINNQKIGTLSGGQKSRLAFALLSLIKPNVLILDEPTNHLDMSIIEALADAIRQFGGGVICVSHDLAFITRGFDTVLICEDGKLEKFPGTVSEYKLSITKELSRF